MRFSFMPLAALMTVGAAAPEVSAQEDPAAAATANVRYVSRDGTQLHGYLAEPAGSGKGPAVLMIHEWWGLNNDTARLADALASQGYVVLAADAFRGRVAQTPDAAMKQVQSTPAAQIAADLDAALDYLEAQPRVDAQRVASLGFCFGGSQSMRMATRRPDLSAAVIFYGSGPITDANDLGTMNEVGAVLGIYGAEDQNIPVSSVQAFEKALNAKGVKNEIEIYPGVGHAFVKSTTYRNGAAAEQAWKRMLAFLKERL